MSRFKTIKTQLGNRGFVADISPTFFREPSANPALQPGARQHRGADLPLDAGRDARDNDPVGEVVEGASSATTTSSGTSSSRDHRAKQPAAAAPDALAAGKQGRGHRPQRADGGLVDQRHVLATAPAGQAMAHWLWLKLRAACRPVSGTCRGGLSAGSTCKHVAHQLDEAGWPWASPPAG